MGKGKLLKPEQLTFHINSEIFDFDKTDEISPFEDGLIGQERAVEAMDLGFLVKQEGYNIFMAGITGTGRTTYARTLAKKKSSNLPVPPDLCYVYNFGEPEKPIAMKLPSGTGKHFKEDMSRLIKELKTEIPEAFAGEEYEERKNKIINNYRQKSNNLMEKFEKEAREKGFILKNTPQGLLPLPLDEEGNPISQEKFHELPEEKREELRNLSQNIQNRLDEIIREIGNLKNEAQKELDNQKNKIGMGVIFPHIENLIIKYKEHLDIARYLENVKKDILENLDKFLSDEETSTSVSAMKNETGDFFIRYTVNLLVNNNNQTGAPVIVETNPTYYNLFGKIEGKSNFGTITTDFTMIRAGAVHKANGGFLILKAEDLLHNPYSWETLKRTLINREITVENVGEQFRAIPITTLKPEPIPINIKVIIIGNPLTYHILYNYDEEFKKLFKIRADFNTEMEKTERNIKKFASFIANISRREGIKHFTATAVSRVLEYSSRLAGSKSKLSTRFNEILELLYEANAWSERKGNKYIDEKDVIKAIEEKEKRSNLPEEKVLEMIGKNHILVDVDGKEVGQINGLSIYQSGHYSFGRPSRITARTYLGQEGVINIEREADMSGKIHDKGVMILSGYLGGKYAQDTPLSLSASLTFEQNYGGVDGDSASCAELIALISAIGNIPIKQNMAITGSMNQHGKVQPIGGVNEKIEGFYKVCKLKGLTGEQGVVIPEQNIENLMLKEEVVQAIKDNKFNIFSITDIDDAIELMMGIPANDVHSRVMDSLKQYAEQSVKYRDED